ncbi:MAG: aminodeoxychorismate/anthranilate synthase component II [Bdellovibrionaceae bacterium]|nr:aminodeoxychorismate/anthranilate synthase component II [Pseudobdellovibrionaceae bacterium]
MICILDHQDSFTYNIYAMIKSLGGGAQVLSTAQTTLGDLENKNISAFILSPGPGHPDEATLFYEVLKNYAGKKPILGICLGHQAIARFYGASVQASKNILHGKAISVQHDSSALFEDMPKTFLAMRYNSLTVETSLSPHLLATAWTEEATGPAVMGLRHKHLDVSGVQFHPESVGTPEGKIILRNFLKKVYF